MNKFDYKVFIPEMKKGLLKKSFSPEDLQAELQAMGAEGWEVVSTIPIAGQAGVGAWGSSTAQVVFILKREITASPVQ